MSVSNDTSGRLQAIAVRNIEFFRPKAEDIPWQLLAEGAAGLNAEQLRSVLDLDYTRVACRIEPPATIGVYAMLPVADMRFDLISVAVVPELQGQLVGRRLLGHALGLAESKAAREVYLNICVDNARGLDMARRYGFVTVESADTDSSTQQLCFELTPE